MRVLVTGAEGHVGSAVVTHLLAHGHAVTTLTRPPAQPHAGVRVVPGDARDVQAVRSAVQDVDAVAHLAAFPNPWSGEPDEVFANNTQATFTVLWSAAQAGVRRLVVAGSINALGLLFHPRGHRPPRYPLDEQLPQHPADPYSLSKVVDELTLQAVGEAFGATGLVLRLPLVVTPDSAAGLRRFQAQREDAGAGDAWSWIDARDAAEAFRLALTVPYEGTHVVQIAAPTTLSDVPTGQLLARHAPDVPAPPYAGHAAPIDTSRAAALLGFVPVYLTYPTSEN